MAKDGKKAQGLSQPTIPLASLSFLFPGLLLRDVFTWVRQTLPEKEMDVLLPLKGPMSTNHACGILHLIGVFAGRGERSVKEEYETYP